jgi:hypothetical protein
MDLSWIALPIKPNGVPVQAAAGRFELARRVACAREEGRLLRVCAAASSHFLHVRALRSAYLKKVNKPLILGRSDLRQISNPSRR